MSNFRLGLSPILLLAVASCERVTTGPSETRSSTGQTSEAPAGVTVSREGAALVRFVNADPAGKPRELSTMDGQLFGDVAYKSLTPYTEIPTSRTRFLLKETGGTESLDVTHSELLAGIHYTLVAAPTTKGLSRLLFLRDDLEHPEPGKAKVRMINATMGVNDLDLYVAGTEKKIEKGLDATDATPFTEVTAGTFEIHPARQVAAPRLSKLKAESGHFYTFVVVGKTGDLDVVVITDEVKRQLTQSAP